MSAWDHFHTLLLVEQQPLAADMLDMWEVGTQELGLELVPVMVIHRQQYSSMTAVERAAKDET